MESKFVKARDYTNMIVLDGEVYSLFYDENRIFNNPCEVCDLYRACYQENVGPRFISLCTPEFAPTDMMFIRNDIMKEFLSEDGVLLVRWLCFL